jgi:hypothetical protein
VCDKCRTQLVAAKYDDATDRWIPRTSAGITGKLIQCSLCGRNRRFPSHNVRQLTTNQNYHVVIGHWLTATEHQVTLPAGSLICWHHSTTYPQFEHNGLSDLVRELVAKQQAEGKQS